MADRKHLVKLKEGVKAWNSWRISNGDIKPKLRRADLVGVDLRAANLIGADLSGADLSGADLREASLIRAKLIEADLGGANLGRADLREANLSRADLREANLSRAKLRKADLGYADLSGANLVRAKLSGANLIRADFRESSLIRTDLSDANLSGVDLSGADLSGADLIGANLFWADLREVSLSKADLHGAKLSNANLRGANLKDANLSNVSLVETNLENTDLTGCRIYGISAWNVKLNEKTRQSNLVITRKDEPAITVDNLEVAQFIYLLLKYEKLRDVINTVTQRGVLLLGRFGEGGLELLQAMADKLREMKYLPIIFDFDRPDDKDYTETVKTLVGLSRFVIVELSGPSVPQELYATVPHFSIPFVPIMKKGSRQYAMFADLLKYPWVLRPVIEYENTDNLRELIPEEIIKPAEDKAKERQEQLSQLFRR